jgi:lipoyl(octanoyl) transferase
LEEVIIRSLARFGIDGWRLLGFTGVWVGDSAAPAKICAIGVKVTTRRVTFHGFALNVNTDMNYFSGIVPCGLHDKGVISMQQMSRQAVSMADVIETVVDTFAQVFGRHMTRATAAAVGNLINEAVTR